ncbi:type II toxin-antitoxin system RelE/ParE family toxin [Xanthomonas campestris]|uniref:type II toxin-antitoxin system RelE/ParE family toxin n=1 Tax=Xanthomonas campestris TaxID=339 RepID=UPI000E328B4D|nr:type II toxin-antitoxin system RelE/ParE family toxin [Xanthomonas campestris]MEA9575682.1 type II toxin-antitoxin system RelE/ParE family toxin [Xanthomonas campestris]RFF70437.1 hypothetical protein D0A39_15875 [Xanthomonas campestris pv. campestris]
MSGWSVDLFPQVKEFLNALDLHELARVSAVITLLEQAGPLLPEPYAKRIKASRHRTMRELRVRYGERVYRILYAFDTKKRACLLVAADKAEYGFDAFYDDFIARADRLMDDHEHDLRTENERTKQESGKKLKGRKPPGGAKKKRG